MFINCPEFYIPEKAQVYQPPYRPVTTVKNPPKPYIETISNVGLIKIGFTEKLLIPSYNLYPEFQRAEYMRETNLT